jgi:hypothetical protein
LLSKLRACQKAIGKFNENPLLPFELKLPLQILNVEGKRTLRRVPLKAVDHFILPGIAAPPNPNPTISNTETHQKINDFFLFVRLS